MYTFKNFIDRLKIMYNYHEKSFDYKYYPENNELWINDKYNYIKISDEEIILAINKNNIELRCELERLKDFESSVEHGKWIICKFKYYLINIQDSLSSVPSDLIERLNVVLKGIHFVINSGIDYIEFERKYKHPDIDRFVVVKYIIELHRDDKGYFYKIKISDYKEYDKLIKGSGFMIIINTLADEKYAIVR